MKTTKKAVKNTKPTPCTCLELVQVRLAKQNCRVVRHMQLNFTDGTGSLSGPCVEVEKINPHVRQRLPILFCAFCPFCGQKFA